MPDAPLPPWSLPDLIVAVAARLQGAPAAADGRVRDVPDERTIRWYQSAGMMDRPLGYEGRSARYGRRHLLQVLAIKLLQAQGLSLAQVQRALAGASDEQLEAAVADGLGADVPAPHAVAPPSVAPPSVAPPSVAPPPIHPSPRLIAEIAPGVTVIVDPALVADPVALLSLLTRAIPGGRT